MAKEFLSFNPKASADAVFSVFAETDTSTLVLPPFYGESRMKAEQVKKEYGWSGQNNNPFID